MGKTILTPKQYHFLELVRKEPQITKRFYLTGGTALAEFYLKHRESHDIDLFTEEKEVNQSLVSAFLKKISPKLEVLQIKKTVFMGLVGYILVFNDKEELRVDFNYYPFPRIERGTKYGGLQIDSIYDIAVNKLHTLFVKPRTRDYIDLFLIMKERDYSLRRLILDAKIKFDWDIDRVTLGSHFLRVKDLDIRELPKMLVPFDKKEMENFFLALAKSLEKDIFK